MRPETDWSDSAIGIAGAGRVGQALGRLLVDNGLPVVAVASRTAEHARTAAAFIGAGVQAVSYSELPVRASRILIAVPDSAVEMVAGLLGGVAVVLHTCGTKGTAALHVPALNGAARGTLHPLQTIPDAEAGVTALRGVAFAVSGDEAALAWAKEIVGAAQGRMLSVSDGMRPLYHAAAVMASNYVVALVAAAEQLMIAAGMSSAEALQGLAPLARTSLENALEKGPAAALTGPIERGDLSTVRAHLDALAASPGAVRSFYSAAGLQTLEVARRRGLPPGRANDLERLLLAELSLR